MKHDNELIAEFMEFPYERSGFTFTEPRTYFVSKAKLEYHKSWDWLMPVVVKCNEIATVKQKEFIEDKDLDDPTGWKAWSYRWIHLSTNIDAVYKQVVKFIQWYNKISKL